MTAPKTYKLLGHTVKVVPDEDHPGLMCEGCVFQGKNKCPSAYEERTAGLNKSCVDGYHKYVEVQPT